MNDVQEKKNIWKISEQTGQDVYIVPQNNLVRGTEFQLQQKKKKFYWNMYYFSHLI